MSSTKERLQPTHWRDQGLLYHVLSYFYRKRFGAKVWKLGLDAGCGCPNRDGTLATEGCIFCNPLSFSPARRRGLHTVSEQIDDGIARLRQRNQAERFIAYFQPGSNTYGPVARLRAAFQEAVARPEVVGLAVGTRPDCAGNEVLDMLAELAQDTWVVVEYGVQTIHDQTLDRLNRRHHYAAFLDAFERTKERGLNVGVHIILGLPGESREDMRATARELARLDIHSVKLHNLYAVKDTLLGSLVSAGEVRLPEFQEYVEYAVDFLEELPDTVVVERLSGDAPPEHLIAPSWCLNKSAIRPAIEAEFRRRSTYQGKARLDRP